ncbi:unnamed protein product [Meganyctiphanes norvegica]|uniref:Major facilitator superfamily associated domain-containing protein n=1 Tax=Meganyctiphanes norvegica TaxID=48144 RepID=A0AAV2SGD5_MEGNR
MSPLTGYLIDSYTLDNGQSNFLPSFIAYCGMKLIASVVILFTNLDFRKPSNKVFTDFKHIIRQPEILAFLFVMFLSGTLYGYLDTFLFWLLEDLGAGKSLMGITVTVGNLTGIPILICSHYIIKGIGHANTIILGFAFYSIRMLGYSFISNPWWAMPFELLECFTNSLLGTAAASYAGDMATPGTIATLQGLYGGLHHGVGRGAGGLIGGFLASVLDIHIIFRIMAAACAIICIVYFILNYLFFQKLQNERRKLKDDEKKVKEIASSESPFNELHMNNIESKKSALDNPAFTMESEKSEKSDSQKNGFVVRNNISKGKLEENSG